MNINPDPRAAYPWRRLCAAATVLAASIALTLLAGCQDAQPAAVVLIADVTASAGDGRRSFLDEFEKQVVATGALGNGAIAVIELSGHPRLLYGGPARRDREVRAALRQLQGSPGAGSDPLTALELAEAWLAQPAFRRHRKVCIGWVDLIADPEKRPDSPPRVFEDALRFRWTKVRPETHLYGLPLERIAPLQQAWTDLPVLRLHLPADRFQAADARLVAASL